MPVKVEFVTARRLRHLFNRHYLVGVNAGAYSATVTYEEPAHPKYNQPKGTRSLRVRYETKAGSPVAECHMFILPDGSIGASGKPDPKQVCVGDTIYTLETDPRRHWFS